MVRAILEVTDLNKHFGGIHVTQNVNFRMMEGEQSAIIARTVPVRAPSSIS